MSARALAGVLQALLAVSLLGGCTSDGYVIGRFRDEACAQTPDALVCSDFEQPDLSDWSDVLMQNTGHVEETDDRAYVGHGSLHAGSAGPESVGVVGRSFATVTNGQLFFRAHFFVPSGRETETMNVLFLGDYATPDPFQGIDVNLEAGAPSIYVPGSAPDRVTSTTVRIPTDQWFCLRMDVTVSRDAGSVTLLVDDVPAVDQPNLNTAPDAGIHRLRAGVDWSSKQATPFDVYIDDLVLATTPVACDDASTPGKE
jgi:hypothetical protein